MSGTLFFLQYFPFADIQYTYISTSQRRVLYM